MDNINIINFIERSITYSNFLNFDVDSICIDEKYKNKIKNVIKSLKSPEIIYYDYNNEESLNYKESCAYFYNFHEIDTNIIYKIIQKSDYILCITDNIKKTREFIEDINKKCIIELFREKDNSLLGLIVTMKYIYSVDIKYIFVHF